MWLTIIYCVLLDCLRSSAIESSLRGMLFCRPCSIFIMLTFLHVNNARQLFESCDSYIIFRIHFYAVAEVLFSPQAIPVIRRLLLTFSEGEIFPFVPAFCSL